MDSGDSANIIERPFPMETDATFHVTPLVAVQADDNVTKLADPTFIQNQISIQRSPSAAKSQASALSRNLSIRSNASYDAGLSQSAILGVLSTSDDKVNRGRGRGDSNASLVEATGNCKLSKSNSTSTDRSVKSAHSSKSVRSVAALGSYPLGSLRVHSPSPTRLVNAKSHEFLKSGDVVIIRDITPGSIFGYDTEHFVVRVEGQFEGLKDIPPGAHFIWGGSAENSSRSGVWIMSATRSIDEFGEIHVRRWDKFSETLQEEVSTAEIRIQKDGLPEISNSLLPYVSQAHKATEKAITQPAQSRLSKNDSNLWNRLTKYIKGALLNKVTGRGWNHWQVASTDDYCKKNPNSPKDDPMDYRKDEVLNFVIPKAARTFSENSIGRDRTEQAMDTTSHIQAVISDLCTYQDSDEIIGELQFCYITGMTLGNLACMEHWAYIVKLLFKAFRLVLDNPKFFRKVIDTVHAQLIYDDQGFDSSIFDHDSDLRDELKILLTTFKSRLNELLLTQGAGLTDEQSAVGRAFEELESWLWRWNWDLRGNYVRSGKIQLEDGEYVDAELKDFEAEDERGEFAPVVVDIDEDGRERGLIRF